MRSHGTALLPPAVFPSRHPKSGGAASLWNASAKVVGQRECAPHLHGSGSGHAARTCDSKHATTSTHLHKRPPVVVSGSRMQGKEREHVHCSSTCRQAIYHGQQLHREGGLLVPLCSLTSFWQLANWCTCGIATPRPPHACRPETAVWRLPSCARCDQYFPAAPRA